jgi:type-1 restriction enzyme R protein
LKDNIDEEYVSKIDENEIWMADDRLKKVAKHLVANHHKKTRNQMYTSILLFIAYRWRLDIIKSSKR